MRSQVVGYLLLTSLLFSACKSPQSETTEEQFPVEGKRSKQDRTDLAIKQQFELTKDPSLGYVPSERLATALEYKTNKLNEIQPEDAVTGVNWVERGPNNVAGRSRVAWFDLGDAANGYLKVWAGAVGGGLWSTPDITAATPVWTKVDDFLDNIAITAFGQHPTSTNIMYAGTGEGWFNADAIEGLGIYKTTDGGATWNRLPSTIGFLYVQDLVVNTNGDIYVALRRRESPVATGSRGILKSTDGGVSWTQVMGFPVTGGSDRATDIEIAANGDIYVTLGIFNSGRIYRSIAATHLANTGNAGTWDEITPHPTTNVVPLDPLVTAYNRIELACAPSDANVLYAIFQANGSNDANYIKQYNAATNTWVSRSVPTIIDQGNNSNFTRGQAWYDLIAAVDPNDPNRLYIGGVDALRSDNNGSSWTQMTTWALFGAPAFGVAQNVHADHHMITYAPGSSSRAIWGTDGGIDYTANADIIISSKPTFARKNTGYNVTQFYAAANHPTNANYFLAGAQDNGTQRFTSAGLNNTTSATGGDGGFCHIDQDDPTIQITAYTNNNYAVSTNGGASFTNRFKNNNGGFINPTDYDDAANILYGGNSAGTYFRWLSPATDGINSSIPITGFSGGTITHVTVSPLTANRVYFGLNNGAVVRVDNANTISSGAGVVIRPTTAGSSVSSIAIDPTNENHMLLTYSNYGITSVFESMNATQAGATWTAVEGNLPDMPVRWAMFDPRNSDWALLGTELGVWSTDNLNAASTDWDPTNSGLANVRIDMLQYTPGTRVLSAATHGRGLYTATMPNVTAPEINFSAGTGSATEVSVGSDGGCRTFRDYIFNVTIANAPSANATVTFAVDAGNTATQGIDFDFSASGSFSPATNSLTFPAGSTTPQTVAVRIYNDAEIENTESFTLSYTISGASDAVAGHSFQTFNFSIASNDVVPVGASITPAEYTIGAAQIGSSNVSPFKGNKLKHRIQSLYTAAELNAAGLQGPTNITAMQLEVATKNSTVPFNGFTITIGNTTAATLSSGFIAATFTTVYSGVYNSVVGDNNFNFTTPFAWNGTSNIVVQICYDNEPSTLDALSDVIVATSAPLGTGIRASTYLDHVAQVGAGCSLGASFVSDSRMVATFTAITAGVTIESVLNNSRTESVGNNGTYYFYSTQSGNLLNRISDASANLGCVSSSIFETGTTWPSFLGGFRSQKVWDISPATNPGASFTIGLYFSAAELGGFDPNTLRIGKTTAATMAGANSSNTLLATLAPPVAFGSGYLYTATFTGFSKFFLVTPGSTLPVDIVSFSGSLDANNHSALKWQAANQVNFSHFEIQRSYDGINYSVAGKVNATQNPASLENYNFTDPVEAKAVNFYRLRMVDLDGRSQISAVVKILGNASLVKFVELRQNPVRDNINFLISNERKENVTVQLFSSGGQLVKQWQLGNVEGNVIIPINNLAMANGIYNLRIIAGTKVAGLKISKQ